MWAIVGHCRDCFYLMWDWPLLERFQITSEISGVSFEKMPGFAV